MRDIINIIYYSYYYLFFFFYNIMLYWKKKNYWNKIVIFYYLKRYIRNLIFQCSTCGKRSRTIYGFAHLINYFSNAVWLCSWLLIRSVGIFRSFQLNLQSFHSNLETIHRLNSCLSTGRIIKGNKTWIYDKNGSLL